MIEVFLFIFKYKIIKDKYSLPKHSKEFFLLSHKKQRKVLDKYFKNLDKNFNIDYYFNNDEYRHYEKEKEVSFFESTYFCYKIINLNINNIGLIDKFKLPEERINKIINYSLELLTEQQIKLDINNILVYPHDLPKRLSKNIKFMTYLTNQNIYNIKYITYNENNSQAQRELIKNTISKLEEKEFNISNFLLQDKTLPKLLKINIDFIIYIIKNDIDNIKYLDESTLHHQTLTDRKRITQAILTYLSKNNSKIEKIEQHQSLALYLNKDFEFLNYIINQDVTNIKYVDWHNLTTNDTKNIIDCLAIKLVKENINFNHTKYPFQNILKENYMFMAYLITKDKKNIKEIKVPNKKEVNKLIDIYLNKYKRTKFDINNYIDETGYINNYLVENKHMLSYLIRNDNNVFKYIDFITLESSNEVVENILKEIEKDNFVFKNESFLRNEKYPIILSNSYRFMRYVIDKNFNNLAYIDISMIDPKELKRIINYAFRMVYYIRGNNKKLNFDLEGYFQNSDIINNEYFQECLRSL